LVSLTVLKAVKVTPTLLARFALLPLKKVQNPCLYCPGICLANCPTFLESGNLALSPLGYSRSPTLWEEKCAKCWRCTLECPLGYALPEAFGKPVRVEVEVVRRGAPLLVSVGGLDTEYSEKLSTRLGAGLAVVKGLDVRYTRGGSLDSRSVRKARKELGRAARALALSPEASHALGLEFLPLHLPELGIRVDYEGVVHIPCLLRSMEARIIESLRVSGARITGVDRDSCLKVKPREWVLYLCPRARQLGLPSIYDLITP
jgi:glycolate oxidase iron-sulfur subunit